MPDPRESPAPGDVLRVHYEGHAPVERTVTAVLVTYTWGDGEITVPLRHWRAANKDAEVVRSAD